MELAVLLGLVELDRGAPPTAWLDPVAATELALHLLQPGHHDDAAIAAAWLAHRALHAAADGTGSRYEALRAARAFVPYFDALLGAVTLRKLTAAQGAVAARWVLQRDVLTAERYASSRSCAPCCS